MVVIEKEASLGGNTAKANSGINVLTPEQGDSADIFRARHCRRGAPGVLCCCASQRHGQAFLCAAGAPTLDRAECTRTVLALQEDTLRSGGGRCRPELVDALVVSCACEGGELQAVVPASQPAVPSSGPWAANGRAVANCCKASRQNVG